MNGELRPIQAIGERKPENDMAENFMRIGVDKCVHNLYIYTYTVAERKVEFISCFQ